MTQVHVLLSTTSRQNNLRTSGEMLSSQLSQILKANIATLNSLYNFFTYKDECIKEQYLSCCKSVIGLLLVFLLFEL